MVALRTCDGARPAAVALTDDAEEEAEEEDDEEEDEEEEEEEEEEQWEEAAAAPSTGAIGRGQPRSIVITYAGYIN